MSDEPTPIVFDKERADSYDRRFEKLHPMRDALHLVARLALGSLPADANVLCVGAGTGAELVYLAKAFPAWRFTVVEPAEAMMAICRERAENAGFTSRCKFHQDFASSLPEDIKFNAATSILVSHFLVDRDARVGFFADIYKRLQPGGLLLTADLASLESLESEVSLLSVWMRGLAYAGMSPEVMAKYRSAFGRDVSVQTPNEVALLLREAGFATTKLVTQTLLMHGWLCQRAV